MKEKFLFIISIFCWITLIVSAFDDTMTTTIAGKWLIISLFGGGCTFYAGGIMAYYERVGDNIKENRALIAFGISVILFLTPIYAAVFNINIF